ncbi:MAG: hypothetical protein IIC01_00695 [Planctomycetes bacterium]|nr:hypothetical protein [Planctomycetota bacterium]
MPVRDEPDSSRPQARRRARYLVLPAIALALLTFAGLIYRNLTDAERIRALAESYLEQYVHGRVKVGSASFSILGGIQLSDVVVTGASRRLKPAARDGESGSQDDSSGKENSGLSVITCPRIEIAHNPWAALLGRLSIESLVVFEPTLSIVHGCETSSPGLAGLFRRPAPPSDSKKSIQPSTIELRDARVRVHECDGGTRRMVEDLTITVRARRSEHDALLYDVVWHSAEAQPASGHAQLDLRSGSVRNVRGGTPAIGLEAFLFLAEGAYPGAREWGELMGLQGRVRARDYDLIGQSDGGRDRFAVIELSDASVSIPIDREERSLAPQERTLRLEQAHGTMVIDRETVTVSLDGLFHGSPCSVTATLGVGFERLCSPDEIDFEVTMSVRGFELPGYDDDAPGGTIRWVNRRPELARFLRDFDPRGRVDVELEVSKRAGAQEPIVLRRVRVTANGADASCRFLPYRLYELRGTVEYTAQGGIQAQLRGARDGGLYSIDAWLEGLDRCSAANVSIVGTGIPINRALVQAMPERFREIVESLQPAGVVDVGLSLTRPACGQGVASDWRSHTVVSFDDLSALGTALPSPLEAFSGSIVFDGDRVELRDIAGPIGQGRVEANGVIHLATTGVADVDVTIQGWDIPIDDSLLSALPAHLQDFLESAGVSGTFDLETLVGFDPASARLTQSSRIHLKEVSFHPEHWPTGVESVQGVVRILDQQVVLEELTGRFQEATVSADGVISWSGAERSTNLTVRARDLRLDERLVESLPQTWRAAIGEWRIESPIEVELQVRESTTSLGKTASLDVQGIVRLHDAVIRHPSFALPLEGVRGEVVFDSAGLRGPNLVGRYGSASVRAALEIEPTVVGHQGGLTLTATGLSPDDIRGLLPEGRRSTWDQLRPLGTVDVHIERLECTAEQGAASPLCSIEGSLFFHDVSLPGIASMEHLSGTLTGSGSLKDSRGGSALSGNLSFSSMSILGRKLTRLESDWSFLYTESGPSRLALDRIQAELYNGALTGRFEAMFLQDRIAYNLRTTAQGVDLKPFVRTDRRLRPVNDSPAELQGVADIHLYASGILGDPSARRGGGRFVIREGRLFRLPIMLAILNVLNLSIPEQGVFQDAQSSFFIVGNDIQLQDLLLQSDVLSLAGSGTLSLPDGGVDLTLVHVSGRRGARVPLLTDLLEQASRELIELHVTGPLYQPTVRARPLRTLSDELKRLFQKKKSNRAGSGGF